MSRRSRSLLSLVLLQLLLALQFWQPAPASAATLEEVRAITATAKDNILVLNDKNFPKYVEEPRDYSLIIIFSVHSNAFKCEPCERFESEYRLVTSSWEKMGNPNELVFAYVDFGDGRHSFGKMSITSAPAGLYLPPTLGPNASKADPIGYDFNRHGLIAEQFAEFVRKVNGIEMTIYRPIDWVKRGITAAVIITSLVAFKLMFKHILVVIRSVRAWSSLTLVIILMMTSGFMWNQIRHPPYMGGSASHPEYIAPGFQTQFGVETQIMAVLYAACAFATVSLVTRVPKIRDGMTQRVVAFVWLLVLVVGYSLIMMTFRKKNGSYPFKLLF
ncbi:hypothetical protein THASP1DRAFT_12841 [Thamnocephalis sphaerospora]|uniref:Uncharacterized protein n=1 Tax=Thamnocephalis sphaerospora TaxID=78915 RepID=A0A4P9XVV2_9FUNG|nr:hypothetical protein THASP1DRAFT_12841 [Thamnocephalis sphaerospora]|eukprot:RKP10415.1 hypothetical protein THASP1DRAFT_12841 [Thamnocephalis sphaerospora]